MDYVIQFVAKLLHPSQSESASVFVGGLITQLIKSGSNELLPVLPDLLRAVTERLESAKLSLFIQTLVMVFAHLIQTQMETVINFLTGITINGKDGLSILLNAWCEHFGDFQGFYSIKVRCSATAMAKLFMSGDPRLQAITVKGDLIEESNNPDKYTMIPFPAKAVKLLLADLQQNLDSEMAGPSLRGVGGLVDEATDETVDSDEDDEDWEDVEGPGDKFQYLSDILDEGDIVDVDATDFEGADSDLWDDPIYQTNMKVYLLDFFKTCRAQNTNNFAQLCEHFLTEPEKKRLQNAIQ
ncbi:hypothetical protein HK104_009937 [Borealophlyctis nickersoniae]|nr:hypothetical protein HK104_009937 [Borealophlyctis nickersoniae]